MSSDPGAAGIRWLWGQVAGRAVAAAHHRNNWMSAVVAAGGQPTKARVAPCWSRSRW